MTDQERAIIKQAVELLLPMAAPPVGIAPKTAKELALVFQKQGSVDLAGLERAIERFAEPGDKELVIRIITEFPDDIDTSNRGTKFGLPGSTVTTTTLKAVRSWFVGINTQQIDPEGVLRGIPSPVATDANGVASSAPDATVTAYCELQTRSADGQRLVFVNAKDGTESPFAFS